MSEYRIQSETLEGIADAIREKTGDSSLIAPEDMATEIGSISGWGLKLLIDQTATEDVSSIQIDFTQEMLDSVGLLFVMNGTTSANEWIYPTFDTTSKQNLYLPQMQNYQNFFFSTFRAITGGHFIMANNAGANSLSSASPAYIYFQLYYATSVFNRGFNIKVYGVILP